jgi:hypothetical protein
MSTTNAPKGRSGHATVWTGTDLIVWGGASGGSAPYNDGGRYRPAEDKWYSITTTNSPAGATNPASVWTGSEMIVWGGSGEALAQVATGGRYDPTLDKWTAMTTTGALSGRWSPQAVWTGTEVIIWGGQDHAGTESGKHYLPSNDSWEAMTSNAEPGYRFVQIQLWTGSKMIVWSGMTLGYQNLSTGGIYDPQTDSWVPIVDPGVQLFSTEKRSSAAGVWTGTELLIWGGVINTNSGAHQGLRYTP